jgi:large subunit ribosomal protein L10e
LSFESAPVAVYYGISIVKRVINTISISISLLTVSKDVKNGTKTKPLSLTANERCQVRHNALESARITANRALEKKLGVSNYRLRVRVYPHNVLRENKQATGAGADRVSQGMRSAYGKIVSIAAHVKPNQIIMTVETTEQNIDQAKDALRKAGMKIPSPCKINY